MFKLLTSLTKSTPGFVEVKYWLLLLFFQSHLCIIFIKPPNDDI